jgi:hypothetical protein
MTILLSEIEMYCRHERTRMEYVFDNPKNGEEKWHALGRWAAMYDVLKLIKEGSK